MDNLVAQIIQANYDGYVATTSQLEVNYLRQAERQCLAVIQLFKIIDDASVIDRETERRLAAISYLWDSAERTLEDVRRHLAIHGAEASADAS